MARQASRHIAQSSRIPSLTVNKTNLLLIAHGHVVKREKKNKCVFRILLGLDLLQHSLSFLKKNQGFFIAFLGYEVYCTLVKLIDNDGNLIFIKVKIFVIVSFK